MMKKFILYLTLLCNIMLLSGCEIHFGDKRYEIPWQVALIINLLISLPFILLFYFTLPNKFWAYCPKCESVFYVKKRVISFKTHSPEYIEFLCKCPCCGKRSVCRSSYNQDR